MITKPVRPMHTAVANHIVIAIVDGIGLTACSVSETLIAEFSVVAVSVAMETASVGGGVDDGAAAVGDGAGDVRSLLFVDIGDVMSAAGRVL
jgi:hypothetical protein